MIPCCNLTGDLISDALAAQVGGIGIAPGANINYDTGHALFEATHGTAPKYAGQDKVNPGSVILSGEMMLRYMGWNEAADRIIAGLEKTLDAEGGHLRLRPPDGGGEGGEVLRVRHRHHQEHGDALMAARPKITVVGAGNVGASVAQYAVERELGDVVLVDVVEGIPQGKALDLAQAGPVHGYDSALVGIERLRRDRGLGHRGDHRGPGPQAGHDPRRPPVQERRDRGQRGGAGGVALAQVHPHPRHQPARRHGAAGVEEVEVPRTSA